MLVYNDSYDRGGNEKSFQKGEFNNDLGNGLYEDIQKGKLYIERSKWFCKKYLPEDITNNDITAPVWVIKNEQYYLTVACH